MAAIVGATTIALSGGSAHATIDNTATSHATHGSTPVTSVGSSVSVPVIPANGSLSIAKSASLPTNLGGVNSAITDAGDTIEYNYIVTNNGNVTISSVIPVDAGPTFNGSAGTGSLGSFSLVSGSLPLAPGQTATFSATYTLATLDVYRAAGVTNGVTNSATATGLTPSGDVVQSPTGTATTTIASAAVIALNKTFDLDDSSGTAAGFAEVGETVTYIYQIANSGNVALMDVNVADVHEGTPLLSSVFTGETLVSDGPLAPGQSSSDATSKDGVWSVLQPGASIVITYTHIVTQAEVDNQ